MKYDAVIIGGGRSGQKEALARLSRGEKVCLVSAGLTLHALEPDAEGQPYASLRQLSDAGAAVLRGDTVTEGKWEGMRLTEVRTVNGVDLQAEEFVLATGRFFSRGLTSDMQGVRESLFGADVNFPQDRSLWFDTDFFAPQPFESFGVMTDAEGRILIGGKAAENVYAVGKILGGKHNAGV